MASFVHYYSVSSLLFLSLLIFHKRRLFIFSTSNELILCAHFTYTLLIRWLRLVRRNKSALYLLLFWLSSKLFGTYPFGPQKNFSFIVYRGFRWYWSRIWYLKHFKKGGRCRFEWHSTLYLPAYLTCSIIVLYIQL